MKLHIHFHDPSPTHCGVRVFVNEALAGELILRQEELADFQAIMLEGPTDKYDEVRVDGNPNP